jgi:hypothetical protein
MSGLRSRMMPRVLPGSRVMVDLLVALPRVSRSQSEPE